MIVPGAVSKNNHVLCISEHGLLHEGYVAHTMQTPGA
jgi:hypothetical protein